MLMTKQPIAGVTPPEKREVTVMTVFPTLGAYPAGRLIGRLCRIRVGFGFFTLGKLFALLLIPFAIGLYAFSLLPGVITRYRLTNRRVVGTLDPEAALVATRDTFGDWLARASTGVLGIILGGGSANGNRIFFTCSATRFTNVQEGDRNGLETDQVEFQLIGGDPLEILFQ